MLCSILPAQFSSDESEEDIGHRAHKPERGQERDGPEHKGQVGFGALLVRACDVRTRVGHDADQQPIGGTPDHDQPCPECFVVVFLFGLGVALGTLAFRRGFGGKRSHRLHVTLVDVLVLGRDGDRDLPIAGLGVGGLDGAQVHVVNVVALGAPAHIVCVAERVHIQDIYVARR